MSEMNKLLTPAQQARIRRDEEIVKRYEQAKHEVDKLSITHFSHQLAEELGISWSTVYRTLQMYDRDDDE